MAFPRVKELMQEEFKRIKADGTPVRDIARKIELSPASLYNYAFNDVDPKDDGIKKLAKYFGVTPAYLRSETDVYRSASPEGMDRSASSRIFEATILGRSPEEQLELMERWLRIVKEYDESK